MAWSVSAHAQARRCQRQFFFAHALASPMAKSPIRQEAQQLKQLQTMAGWQGRLVHDVLAAELPNRIRSKRPLNVDALTNRALSSLELQYAFSAAGRYREDGISKAKAGTAFLALLEHEYERPVTAADLERVRAAVRDAVTNLAGQRELLARIYRGSKHAAEAMLRFTIGSVGVLAVPDLVFLDEHGVPVVIDWKIGRSETSDYSRQLVVYARAVSASGRWGSFPAERVELLEVNLAHNVVREHRVTSERLLDLEDFVYESAAELAAIRGDGSDLLGQLAQLDVANAPGTCALCGFARPCVELLAGFGRDAEAVAVQETLW